MRILVVNALYPPLTTGSSHFTEDLAAELVHHGHDVHAVATIPEMDVDPSADVVPTTRLRAHWVKPGGIAFNYAVPVLRRGEGAALRKLIADFRPDVLSCHGQIFDLTWRAVGIGRKTGIPSVVTVHSAIRHTNRAADAVLAAAELTTVRPMLRGKDVQWIAVDKRTYEHTRDRYRIPEERLHFAPVMLHAERFVAGDGEAARARFDLGAGPLILSLGHVVPVRDRVALVRALPLLLDARPDLKVVIVGELYTDEFRQVAEGLGVASAIVTTGRVPHDAIRDLLGAASLETHDLQGIGLGITTLEAMAASVPVVAYVPDDNYPGMSLTTFPELALLPDAEPATIARAVLELLDDPARREIVVEEQHRFVDSIFGPGAVAGRYEAVFDLATKRT
jgi:glycosyltransferase involved in cell wall biosynthesis